MAKGKPAPMERRTPPEEPAAKKRRAVVTPAPDDSLSESETRKRYVAKAMAEHANRPTDEMCSVWIPKLVNRVRAEEWARYWQPRIGVPISLVVKGKGGKMETLVIDHGTVHDPFPERSVAYPWKAAEEAHLKASSRQWTNDGTNGNGKPAKVAEPDEPAKAPPDETAAKAAAAPVHGAVPRRAIPAADEATAPPKGAATGAVALPAYATRAGTKLPLPGTKARAIVEALLGRNGATADELREANGGKPVGVSYIKTLQGITRFQMHDLGNKKWRFT